MVPRRLPTRAIAVALGLALLSGLAACGSSPTRSDVEPTHDLVFEGTLESVPELLLLDSGTGVVRRLLSPGTIATDPEPSPDGTRIAFVVGDEAGGTGDIFVVNRDGTGLRQLTFDPELDDQPSWSPDGARISYASNAGGDVDLWTMAADGSDPRRITNSPEFDTEPAWSPDGVTLSPSRGSSGCRSGGPTAGASSSWARPRRRRAPTSTRCSRTERCSTRS